MKKFISLVLLFCVGNSWAVETWFCVTDQVTGFKFENNQWTPKQASGGQKYVFREGVDRNGNVAGSWINFGEQWFGFYNCDSPGELFFDCAFGHGTVLIDKVNFRFTYTDVMSYLSEKHRKDRYAGTDWVFVALGSCSKI